jgi:hypothetical protein
MKPQAEVLLVTVTKVETEAVLQAARERNSASRSPAALPRASQWERQHAHGVTDNAHEHRSGPLNQAPAGLRLSWRELMLCALFAPWRFRGAGDAASGARQGRLAESGRAARHPRALKRGKDL